jgi:hypothetical protein
MARFALLPVVLWVALPGRSPGRRIAAAVGFSIPVGNFLCVPLINLADRLEMRRYCESRGFRALKLQCRGVIYMDGDLKRCSRWPDDFQC